MTSDDEGINIFIKQLNERYMYQFNHKTGRKMFEFFKNIYDNV